MNFRTCTLMLVFAALASRCGAAERPNILLIMADDFGYECVAANGSLDYPTPNLDAMAAEGIRFRHCYSQPICTPSRVKLMTGLSNKRNYVKFGMLDRSQLTFPQLLREAGYATCIAGKWQLGRQPDSPKHFGFDQSLLWQHTRGRVDQEQHDTRYANPRLERNATEIDYQGGNFSTDLFVDFLSNHIRTNRDQPFLAYYPMALVHCPFSPTPDSEDWDPASHGATTYKGSPKYFGDMVAYADHAVGQLLKCLKDHGVANNTIVIFLGDNGTDTPIVTRTRFGKVVGAKGKTTDAGNHVPCIIQWPAQIDSPGRVSDSLVDFSDFFPTLCEATGTQLPTEFRSDGVSLLAELRGQPGPDRDSIFQWYSRNGEPKKAKEFARTQQYKLYGDGQFFDIPKDPRELHPLSNLTKSQMAIRTQLQQRIDEFSDVRPPGGQPAGS